MYVCMYVYIYIYIYIYIYLSIHSTERHTQKVPCTAVPGDVESAIPGLLDDLPSQVGGPARRLRNS